MDGAHLSVRRSQVEYQGKADMTTRVCGGDTPSFNRVNCCRCTLRRAVVLWQLVLTLKSTAIYHLLPFIPLYVFFKEVISQGVDMPRFVVCYIASSDRIASIPSPNVCCGGLLFPWHCLRKTLASGHASNAKHPSRRWDTIILHTTNTAPCSQARQDQTVRNSQYT